MLLVVSIPFHQHSINTTQYKELFSVCQAFSGPGSTKMHYCINLLHDGFVSAFAAWLIWSLPGAFGMWALAVGVSNIESTLPDIVYAFLSGLNAATVGIIALAGVQLSQKAITDKLTRILVFLGGSAGMLYNSLWYFPVLMLLAGIASVVFDKQWLHSPILVAVHFVKKLNPLNRQTRRNEANEVETGISTGSQAVENMISKANPRQEKGRSSGQENSRDNSEIIERPAVMSIPTQISPKPSTTNDQFKMSWQMGLAVILAFLASFVAVMVTRGVIPSKPIMYDLFANMYLAGTIIFGGGPVVIPLLREYVVAEGWVSPRDFLIGLAIIQAFPGPNFNFAVYLGALTALNFRYNSGLGAFLGGIGMFLPGLWTVHGTMGVWGAIRNWGWVKSMLRGVNAAAVGLIYSAVYRLWQVGFIHADAEGGASLADDPWWVVITATSFVGGCWFNISPPVAIIMGGIMGLIWHGVVQT